MGLINILDEQTANLIAAGEVVERPSSAVKELLENSVDAGAKSISLEIKNGGRSLIRVTDDGCGFLREDIPKALLRHATSKIACGDDISGIRTLGFRGEALAAISSVARTEIITRHRSEPAGTRLTADENGIVMCDTGCPDGTTVILRDIFYNTPARQKFLKRDATEGANCVAVAEKLALSHPEISFTVTVDGERKFTTAGDGRVYAAVYAVYGREFAKSLVECDYTYETVSAKGFVTKPDGARGSRAMQTVFVNGRCVKSRTVQAALEEAYKSFIPRGKYPGCVLFVTLSPLLTDVNVHPAKTEIKFASEGDVFRAVYYAAHNAVSQDESGSPFAPQPRAGESAGSPEPQNAAQADKKPYADPFADISDKIAPIAERAFPKADKRSAQGAVFDPGIGEEDLPFSGQNEYILRDSAPLPEEPEKAAEAPAQISFVPEQPAWRFVGQIYDSYLIAETRESLLIIDKHAAHERILYEKLAKQKELHVQELLSGVPVNVGRGQAALLLENAAFLEEKGFRIEEFGEDTVIVRSVPATLSNVKGLQGILEDFAKGISEGNALDFEERCDRALYTVACKAALKAGIKNSAADDENVVRMLAEQPSLRYCPHGRPFIKQIPKREIEKYFDR
ncbi:MAG: DNA mismatch repair endonuclease MutL [Clostridia bacterium]|nr:DNA mismatch repair endonuclease MutL [Clostridia bacterium]